MKIFIYYIVRCKNILDLVSLELETELEVIKLGLGLVSDNVSLLIIKFNGCNH